MADIDAVYHIVQYIDELGQCHGNGKPHNISRYASLSEIIFTVHSITVLSLVSRSF